MVKSSWIIYSGRYKQNILRIIFDRTRTIFTKKSHFKQKNNTWWMCCYNLFSLLRIIYQGPIWKPKLFKPSQKLSTSNVVSNMVRMRINSMELSEYLSTHDSIQPIEGYSIKSSDYICCQLSSKQTLNITNNVQHAKSCMCAAQSIKCFPQLKSLFQLD